MPYIDPSKVLVPRSSVRSLDVIYNSASKNRNGGWSVALLDWEGEEKVAIRWNGQRGNGIGNPQSHGKPTWFVLPPEIGRVVRDAAEDLTQEHGGLLAGYREMAADEEREAEALEWSEALIGDAAGQEG